MLETILGVIVVAVLAVLVYAATKPNSFRVERTVQIAAPPEKIFPLINDFHNWTLWSPFEKLDPDLQRNYMGAPEGLGAVYEYSGRKAGAGRMQITESSAPHKIVSTLDFTRPMRAHNVAEFILRPTEGGTEVTWAMHGPAPYMSKLMTTFFSMDKLVGGQFAEGLDNLRGVAERA